MASLLFRRKFGTIRNTCCVLYIHHPNVFISSRRKILVTEIQVIPGVYTLDSISVLFQATRHGGTRNRKTHRASTITSSIAIRTRRHITFGRLSSVPSIIFAWVICPDYVPSNIRLENNFSTKLLNTILFHRQRGVRVQMLPGIVVRCFQAGVRFQSERQQLRRDVRYDFRLEKKERKKMDRQGNRKERVEKDITCVHRIVIWNFLSVLQRRDRPDRFSSTVIAMRNIWLAATVPVSRPHTFATEVSTVPMAPTKAAGAVRRNVFVIH